MIPILLNVLIQKNIIMNNNSAKPDRDPRKTMLLCILVGSGIGFITGAAFFNIGAGLLIGLSIGIAAGFSLTKREPPNQNRS